MLRKVGSGAKPKITVDDLNVIFQECTLNRKQRKKLQHVVTLELGFNVCRRTIETRPCAASLNQCKSTKELYLTDSQKAQRYKIALSWEH